ncbi:MAG: Tim44 domain-containing protein [Gammaproteobacteria bacterium]|nr:Tim44 domain-containing protein [Gammaproteobacteria bacterium]
MIGLGLLIGPPGDAYAKRLGGGKSFGGRPSYSQPYRPAPDYGATRSAPSAMPSPVQRNQAMRDSFRSRGGLMGMLGGLALGGLLGSMLFGGAFEHINFLDILIFGVVAYLGFRLLAARRGAPQWDTGRGNAGVADGRFARVEPNDPRHASHGSAPAGFDTDVMFRGGHGGRSSAGAMDVPAGFDHAAFISGAKQAYRHLQKAWDNRDYAELRALTTDHVYAELEAQLRASGATDDTEVMALDAQLLGVERAEGRSLANVLFTAKVREGAVSGASTIREVWHFTRSDDSRQPTWYLDGLQQVDE